MDDSLNIRVPVETPWLSPKAGDIVRIYYETGNACSHHAATEVAKELAEKRPDVHFVVVPQDMKIDCVSPEKSTPNSSLVILTNEEIAAKRAVVACKHSDVYARAVEAGEMPDPNEVPCPSGKVEVSRFVTLDYCTCPSQQLASTGHSPGCPLAKDK